MKKLSYLLIVSLATVMLSGCAGFDAAGRKGMIGGGAGAGAGALLGQAIGHNTESTLIGVAVGGMLGYIVGNEMDKYDQQQMNSAFETGPSNQPVAWRNPDSGARYSMTPQPVYQNGGQYCRNAQIEAVIDGRTERLNSTACRDQRGSWVVLKS